MATIRPSAADGQTAATIHNNADASAPAVAAADTTTTASAPNTPAGTVSLPADVSQPDAAPGGSGDLAAGNADADASAALQRFLDSQPGGQTDVAQIIYAAISAVTTATAAAVAQHTAATAALNDATAGAAQAPAPTVAAPAPQPTASKAATVPAGGGFVNLPSQPVKPASTPTAPAAGRVTPTTPRPAAAAEAKLADGYTVSQVVGDLRALQAGDKREGGQPRSDAYLRQIAQGIVDGINKYFPASSYGSPTRMAKTLVASAWKESKYDTNLGNGGVFQCAQNRLDDYNKAHGTNIPQSALSTTGNPAQSIDIALWAMAHPAPGVIGRAIGGEPVPTNPNEAALYYWNYNETYSAAGAGKTEIADYMEKTRYFESLLTR